MQLIVKYFFLPVILFLEGCLRLESSCIWVTMVYNSVEFSNDEDGALLQCPFYSMLVIEDLILVLV